ncbi:MAG: hypothetical protein GTN95_05065, partial [Gammaproteobacteria bacterium]|nr:hypothetical protein [Gammaproteobacteria bacterium]
EFWYRESPDKLVPTDLFDTKVTASHPPRTAPGGGAVWLDSAGRLTRLEIIPPAHDDEPRAESEPDWAPLFDKARLDLAAFEPAAFEWNPQVDSDERFAWTGGAYSEQ